MIERTVRLPVTDMILEQYRRLTASRAVSAAGPAKYGTTWSPTSTL
jgi:hypothetical protein